MIAGSLLVLWALGCAALCIYEVRALRGSKPAASTAFIVMFIVGWPIALPLLSILYFFDHKEP